MPLERKFDEDSVVISIRVPKSQKMKYKNKIENLVDELYKRDKGDNYNKEEKR